MSRLTKQRRQESVGRLALSGVDDAMSPPTSREHRWSADQSRRRVFDRIAGTKAQSEGECATDRGPYPSPYSRN